MATLVTSLAHPPAVRTKLTITSVTLSFLIFYIIALPKGGIKVLGIPLTIGYLLTTLLLGLAMLRASRLALPLDRILALLPCVLLGIWSALVVAVNGTSSTSFTIAYFVSLLYLPFFGMIAFSGLTLDDYHVQIESAFVWAVRFIVTYGIFLFFFKQVTGQWIEIPYLTVNVADVGQLDDKYINRGGIFKLISTYNNGNIFGVSIAMMAPLYLALERRRWVGWALYFAMFLTLSRTAWIAAIMIMAMRNLSRGVRPITLIYLAVGALLAGLMIVGILNALGADLSFLFDRNLGGRAQQLDVLTDIQFIPDVQVAALPEIVYLGMLRYYGVPGLLLFVAHLILPSFILWAEGVRLLSTSRASACLQGLVVYVVVAGADAAYSFIPVMMIFWMVAGFGFWYAHRQAWLLMGSREASR